MFLYSFICFSSLNYSSEKAMMQVNSFYVKQVNKLILDIFILKRNHLHNHLTALQENVESLKTPNQSPSPETLLFQKDLLPMKHRLFILQSRHRDSRPAFIFQPNWVLLIHKYYPIPRDAKTTSIGVFLYGKIRFVQPLELVP